MRGKGGTRSSAGGRRPWKGIGALLPAVFCGVLWAQSKPGGEDPAKAADPKLEVPARLEAQIVRPGLELLLWEVQSEAQARLPAAVAELSRLQRALDDDLQYFTAYYRDPDVSAQLMALQDSIIGKYGVQDQILQDQGELLGAEKCLREILAEAEPPADLAEAMRCHGDAAAALSAGAPWADQTGEVARTFERIAGGLLAEIGRRAADPRRPPLFARRDANAARRLQGDVYGASGILSGLRNVQAILARPSDRSGDASAFAAGLLRRAEEFRGVLAVFLRRGGTNSRATSDPVWALMSLERADHALRDAEDGWRAFAAVPDPRADNGGLARSGENAVVALWDLRRSGNALADPADARPQGPSSAAPGAVQMPTPVLFR